MEEDFSAGTQLSEWECQQRMKEFPLWELAPDSRSMSRTFVAKSFADGLRFFNQIAKLADVEGGHHPDLHLTDSRIVCLILFTSSVKGLTIKDFNLARQIDKHTILFSPKWLKANPHILETLVPNQDKSTVSDTKIPDRKIMSGIGELLQDVQGVIPPTQSGEGNVEEDGDDDDRLENKLLSDGDLAERLRFLSSWILSRDRRSICRTFQARDFCEGIRFFNAVAKLAEKEGHPPELHLTESRRVTIVLTTPQLQGVSSSDIIMAERINSIDVQYSEDTGDFRQRFHGSAEPERSPSEDSEVSQPGDWPVLEVQPPNNSSPQRNANGAKPHPRKSNWTNSAASSANDQDQDTATLVHSLILVYANAGPGGLSIQEAVRRITKLGLPGLKEKAKTVQVAKVTNNHPDFVACDGVIGCFALRRALLRSFQSGAVDALAYADDKKLEISVLEKYVSEHSPKPVSPVHLPPPQARVASPAHPKQSHRRNCSVAPDVGLRQPA